MSFFGANLSLKPVGMVVELLKSLMTTQSGASVADRGSRPPDPASGSEDLRFNSRLFDLVHTKPNWEMGPKTSGSVFVDGFLRRLPSLPPGLPNVQVAMSCNFLLSYQGYKRNIKYQRVTSTT